MRQVLAEKGFMEPREVHVTRRDGTPLSVVMTAREMRGPDGRLLSRQATHLDVTDRQRTEEERSGWRSASSARKRWRRWASWREGSPMT